MARQPVVQRDPPPVVLGMRVQEVEDQAELHEEVQVAPVGRAQDGARALAVQVADPVEGQRWCAPTPAPGRSTAGPRRCRWGSGTRAPRRRRGGTPCSTPMGTARGTRGRSARVNTPVGPAASSAERASGTSVPSSWLRTKSNTTRSGASASAIRAATASRMPAASVSSLSTNTTYRPRARSRPWLRAWPRPTFSARCSDGHARVARHSCRAAPNCRPSTRRRPR